LTCTSTRFWSRIERMPKIDCTSMMPRPRISMWWRKELVAGADQHVAVALVIVTTSSATRPMTALDQLERDSDLPTPLCAVNSSPRPIHDTSEPCPLTAARTCGRGRASASG
jgi:hypothetical protein